MLKYDFEASVGFWLATANQAYTRTLQQALAPHGITFRQAQVIGWLVADGPMSQRDLADRMLIDPPNLVGVLDRMSQAGLVERRENPDDRRKKTICVLPGAKKRWEKIAQCARVVRESAVEGMTEKERATLKDLLGRLRSNLSNDETTE